jgi:putative phage-type endonuclease
MTQTLIGGSAVPVGHAEPSSPEGQELRREKLGGSEIAAVLGLSPYESHLSLWWRKKGWAGPKHGDAAGEQLMDWGKRLEPVVYARFLEGEDNAQHVWRYNPGSFVHPDRPWHLCSPDAIRHDGAEIVEIKTVQNELDWGEEGTDQIPIYYRTQCIWYMAALGARRCWVPTLIRGAFYKEYVIEWNQAVATDAEILIEAGRQFIQSLLDDIPPPIDGHDQTLAVIRERHPDIDPGDVEIPQDLADAYIAAVIEERAAKEIKQRWSAEVLNRMGRARNAIDETQTRFAYRKPASNGSRTPFLAVDPALLRSLKPAVTIRGLS